MDLVIYWSIVLSFILSTVFHIFKMVELREYMESMHQKYKISDEYVSHRAAWLGYVYKKEAIKSGMIPDEYFKDLRNKKIKMVTYPATYVSFIIALSKINNYYF